MSEATDAARRVLASYGTEDVRIVARAVLAQERRVCGTCANWDRESAPALNTNAHRCRLNGGSWHPDEGCTRHEPASEEAGT